MPPAILLPALPESKRRAADPQEAGEAAVIIEGAAVGGTSAAESLQEVVSPCHPERPGTGRATNGLVAEVADGDGVGDGTGRGSGRLDQALSLTGRRERQDGLAALLTPEHVKRRRKHGKVDQRGEGGQDVTGTGQRVGYQGMPGAYSEEALLAFAPEAEPVSYRTLQDLFPALVGGEIDRAFVPVENSHAGSVVEAYDLMLQHPVTIEAEWVHPVHHYLWGLPHATRADIRRVYSHPQALAQSAAFLRAAGLDIEPYYDTAGAARMVAEEGDPTRAAVAGGLAGERYGLVALAEGIETSADNATRFMLLAPGEWTAERTVQAEGPGRTTLVFATEHRPGALVRALSTFSRQQVNLSHLESRPSRERPWEYHFITELDGYAHDAPLRTALMELRRLNPMVRVLGSYPRAPQTGGA